MKIPVASIAQPYQGWLLLNPLIIAQKSTGSPFGNRRARPVTPAINKGDNHDHYRYRRRRLYRIEFRAQLARRQR
jgi:hypothetical protein